MKAKNNSLLDKVNTISFSDEINEDLININEPIKNNQEYENYFI